MACNACYITKIKCSRGSPCDRCLLKGIECLPRVSRQGQRKKVRPGTCRKRAGTECEGTDNELDVDDGPKDNIVENEMMRSISGQLGPTHFGLHLILRQWISFAITRRSFSLMAKASILAKKSGISMDRILCGTDLPKEWSVPPTSYQYPPMDFLRDIVVDTQSEQVVAGALLLATYC